MRVPTYADGKPTNLQAAIVDAEYWLRWLRSRINEQRPPVELNEYRARMRPELIEKLRLAIRALEEFLPDEVPAPSRYPTGEVYQELPPELWLEEGRPNPLSSRPPLGGLTPVQQAEFDLIKAKLRAKQQGAG